MNQERKPQKEQAREKEEKQDKQKNRHDFGTVPVEKCWGG